MMVLIIRFLGALLAALALSTLGLGTIAPVPAKAAVYCKTVGVPKGCVARPAAGVVVAPVYCTAVGVPVGCVVRPRTVVVAPVVVAGRGRARGGRSSCAQPSVWASTAAPATAVARSTASVAAEALPLPSPRSTGRRWPKAG